MEKIIKAGNYEFPAKSTAAALISYKANFGRDGIRDLVRLSKSLGKSKDAQDIVASEDFDLDVFFRFLWVFAKAADKSIPPLEEWLGGFDIPPLDFAMEALKQSADMLSANMRSSVKQKN